MSLEIDKAAASKENVKKKGETMEDVEMSPADGKESADSGKTATKRPHKKDGPQAKRKKENARPKNALMQLNELKPGLKYVIESQEGPPHNPIFIAHVEVNDVKYIGKGHSKQLAKHAAAEAALKSFVQFRNMPEVFQSLSTKRQPDSVDFTDDSVITENVFDEHEQSKTVGGNESTYWQHKVNNKLRKYVTESEKKNPVVLLNEIWPGLTYNCVAENPLSIDQRFVMTLDLDGEQFEGAGPSKKAAKAAVARAVLSQKYGVKFHSYTTVMDDSDKALFDFPQELADEMGKLVHDTVDKIAPVSKGFPQWKALAAVVMTKDEAMTDKQVICFGTGTKSLKGANMSLNGAVLNDCHAEVIARRCLKDFFFSQLELHVSGHANQSIFEKVASGKFKLKSNHRFHFYVTSAPCGDAGVFPVQEEDIIAELNTDHSGYKSGVLRTKLESGDGTIPVETSLKSEQKAADTPGQMTKYHIMSCSDKITTWNILGVQGSLLNYFIEPIYFHTIIIGQLFHRNHMLNAVFKRIQPALVNLPPPFVLYKPKLTSTSTGATRYLVPAPQVSINWTCGLDDPEFVVAKNGKTRNGEVSRLAKRQFFQRFNKMHNLLLKSPSTPKFYGAVKKASPNYAQAKEAIVKAFFTCGLGIWKRKPAEQEWFDLNF